MSKLWQWRDARGQEQYSNSLWNSSDDWLVLMAPKCATPSHHLHQPGHLIQAGWVHGFMLLVLNSDLICVPQHKSRSKRAGYVFPVCTYPMFVSLYPLQPHLSVLGWQNWNPTWSSALVAHQPQGSTCHAIWAAFLLTTIVQKGYLRYGGLSISSNQSGHSALTSLNKAFPSTDLLLTGCFSLLHHSEETLQTVVCENPRWSAVIEIIPTIIARPKSLGSHFIPPIWWLMWTSHKATSPNLNDFMYRTAATGLDD